jgi:acetyl-CoA carboxylase carboxyltransferase component
LLQQKESAWLRLSQAADEQAKERRAGWIPVRAEDLFRKELASAENPEEIATARTEEYEGLFANPFTAAERGYIDAVIEEPETRSRLIEGLRLLAGKRDQNPPKKHGNGPQ